MNNESETPWVTASDVGKAEYCPYALYLAKNNVSVSRASKVNMARGNKSHKRWDVERDAAGGGLGRSLLKLVLFALAAALLLFVLSGL